jgi:hypothetical protein
MASERRGLGEKQLSQTSNPTKKERRKESGRDSVSSLQPSEILINDQRKAINTILNWTNNVLRFRAIFVTKAFYKWKYYSPPSRPLNDSQVVKAEDENSDATEQKHNYLLLFTENEKLREELTDIRKSIVSKEKNFRVSSMKAHVASIIRARRIAKLRYYYNLWQNNSKLVLMWSTITQKTLQLDVGIQRIESERNYVKKMESANAHLKLSLVYTISFFKWKLNATLSKLASEQKLVEAQRRCIFDEIQRIRNAVSLANFQEVALLNDALVRGDSLATDIVSLKTRIANIVKQGAVIARLQTACDN